MINFIKRNLLFFFRDPMSVFFSFMSVIIILCLYMFFLKNNFSADLSSPELNEIWTSMMDAWMMGGVVAVSTITTVLGALGIMINDRGTKVTKDFFASPVKRSTIVFGYVLSAVIIGLMLSIFTFIIAEIYIVANGGQVLTFIQIIKCLGVIILSTTTSAAMMFFITLFIKTENAFATLSTIVGTLIGFISGVYMPIFLLDAISFVIKACPISYSALLIRNIMMENALSKPELLDALNYMYGSEGVPLEGNQGLIEFKDEWGLSFAFGNNTAGMDTSIYILCAVAIIFIGLSIFKISKASKQLF